MRFALAIAIILVASPSLAGSCRYYSRGSAGVTQCEGGYYEERHGARVERYGERNGGVNRYPGMRYDERYHAW